jgi:allophanate hydrolase subunit 2
MLADVVLAPARQLRVVPGPQDDYFAPAAVDTLFKHSFRIAPASDRMGLRLAGPRLAHAKGADIVSDGTVGGAIQVPGDGQPIILLADCQTTGGYPKIATVISADLPSLGRTGPGAELTFRAVTVEEAEGARRALDHEIASWPERLKPAGGGFDAERLLDQNLISGVTQSGEGQGLLKRPKIIESRWRLLLLLSTLGQEG